MNIKLYKLKLWFKGLLKLWNEPYCYTYLSYGDAYTFETLEELINQLKKIYKTPVGIGKLIQCHYLDGSVCRPSLFAYVKYVEVNIYDAIQSYKTDYEKQQKNQQAIYGNFPVTGVYLPDEATYVKNYIEVHSQIWRDYELL